MTLLEKAQQIKAVVRCGRATDEHIELALTFLRGDITERQFSGALGLQSSNGASNAWGILRTATQAGRLKVAFTPSDTSLNGGAA